MSLTIDASRESADLLLKAFESLPVTSTTAHSADDKDRRVRPAFPIDEFFTEWFRKKGRLHYFLFKKNHKVTNIQVAELLALLRSYRRDATSEFQFLGVQEFNNAICRIVDSFNEKDSQGTSRFNFIANKYAREIVNTVAIDVMHGSCIVYLPPTVDVDLEAMCARSGYVHSCGDCVYIRNIYKGSKREMFKYLSDYLHGVQKRILLRPYSHEDFTEFDRKNKDALRSGLDDVKVYTQKYFLGDQRLAEIIEEMRAEFKEKLVIPRPGSYVNDHGLLESERKKPDFDPTHSLFLVMDHSLDPQCAARGDRHFIVLYDQQFVNENPFHMFDENKPAWVDHTTLPHTLAGAMINITRPFWPKHNNIVLCDCFAGSGTTLLEACKYDDTTCVGVDIEPITQRLLADNLVLFAANESELSQYESGLSRILSYLATPDRSPAFEEAWHESEEGKAYFISLELFSKWSEHRNSMPEFPDELVRSLGNVTVLARLIFYTRLKAERRYEAAIASGSISKSTALKNELTELVGQVLELHGLRERTGRATARHGHRVTYQGTYSNALSISEHYLSTLVSKMPTRISVSDCRDWVPDRLFDVVVTDPPYGFNTNEDRQRLADVYTSALRKIIGCLKDEGQLVIALPDWSHTGRQIPAFALKDFVAHQVLIIAEELKREVIRSGAQVPRAVGGAPFYWESERALRRAILHFRFRYQSGYRRYAFEPQSLDMMMPSF